MGLLEEAIVDANKLKEAALKNAENLLKEKHAQELKEEFMKFLEQDDQLDLGAEDPLASDLGALDGGQKQLDPTAGQLPSAATEGERACSCPEEDEEIEINFDQLRAQMNNQTPNPMSQISNPQMGTASPPMFEDGGGTIQIPSQLGPELHQYVMNQGDPVYQLGTLAFQNKPAPESLVQAALQHLQNLQGKLADQNDEQHLQGLIQHLQQVVPSTPEIPSNEPGAMMEQEMIDDLLEILNVDLDVVPVGHGLQPSEAEKIEAEHLKLAALQDEERKKEMEELQKAFAKLQKENQSLVSQKETLKKEVALKESNLKSLELEKNKFVGFTKSAAEKLQQYVVDNAKLFYENQILKDVSLNERQKEVLVEKISVVGSAEDAKLLFESKGSTNGRSGFKKERKTLDEHLKRENVFLKKKTELKNNPEKDRMLTLAGLKKNA